MAVRTGGRRRAVAGFVMVAAMAFMVACGAPEYTYVTNSADHTYLKVPTSWHPIEQHALDDAVGVDSTDPQQGFWLQAYDAAAEPSPIHLLGPESDAPAVIIGVQAVPPAVRGQISLDALRDFFGRPVSPQAREQDATDPASPYSGFGLINDEVLTPGDGLRGVHSVYKYRISGGEPQVFDQTVYVNDDASKLYMFFVRCSADCFTQRQKEIESVVSSFTVREKP